MIESRQGVRERYWSPGTRRSWDGLHHAVEPHYRTLDERVRDALIPVLVADMESEYDARLYSAYVHGLDVPFTPSFLDLERRWVLDEERHYAGFRGVLEHVFRLPRGRFEDLERREADFGPLEHLFVDEFSIACLGAYDELATVRAYRRNLHIYDQLGSTFRRFIRSVIADEAWHYGYFLDLILEEHTHRLDEAPEVLRSIRASEGTPYAATFVLDHDDDVFDESVFDEAQRILEKQLLRGRAS